MLLICYGRVTYILLIYRYTRYFLWAIKIGRVQNINKKLISTSLKFDLIKESKKVNRKVSIVSGNTDIIWLRINIFFDLCFLKSYFYKLQQKQ